MDKPLLYLSILLLWIIGLMICLNLARYQVQYDRVRGVALVVDKWKRMVQTVPLDQHKSSLQEPKKASLLKNGVSNNMKVKGRGATPVIIDGIQNKEP